MFSIWEAVYVNKSVSIYNIALLWRSAIDIDLVDVERCKLRSKRTKAKFNIWQE